MCACSQTYKPRNERTVAHGPPRPAGLTIERTDARQFPTQPTNSPTNYLVYPSVCLSACLPACLPASVSLCLSVHLSIYPSIYPSIIYLPAYLFTFVSNAPVCTASFELLRTLRRHTCNALERPLCSQLHRHSGITMPVCPSFACITFPLSGKQQFHNIANIHDDTCVYAHRK